MRRTFPSLLVMLTLFAVTTQGVKAEVATPREMDRVCQNWLTYWVHYNGTWAGSANPRITAVDELTRDGLVLARVFSIAPNGHVVVPVLKELPAVKAYSEKYSLDVNRTGGMPQLLRDVLFHRLDLYIRTYGSLDVPQPADGEVLLDRKHRKNWDCFLKSRSAFHAYVTTGGMVEPSGKGPLLTTEWNQNAPFNNFCPEENGERCVAGCVAIAAAQIMKFHNWPPIGFKDYVHHWDEDLYADFADLYDWDNMHEKKEDYITDEEKKAVAELCYEVGVAFQTDYGDMSSASIPVARDALSEFFRYDDLAMEIESRSKHTKETWFDEIKAEINANRPMLYVITILGISSHAIVCDGWRVLNNEDQYHMNYGWGPDDISWWTVDGINSHYLDEYFLKGISPLRGTVYRVNPDGSGDYTEIQLAIDAANYGQGILVEPGTYDENIDFLGKTIVVNSTQGPEATIIDGNQAGSVAAFQSGVGSDAKLEGFTLQNGNAAKGGGIYGLNGSPRIINCDIHDNSASSNGGGIYWIGSGSSVPQVTNCIISDNSASMGGGIYIELTAMTITNSMVFGNTASNDGGGIYWFGLGDVSPTLTNDTLYGNSAGNQGGGFYCSGSNPLVTNTIFWSNTTEQIHVQTGNPSFTYCDIQGGWTGTGNIDANPFFLNPAAGDFHIPADSPCRDGGDNLVVGFNFTDFEGDPRIANKIVDIGADEFYGGLVINVPADHPTIQEAIDYSEHGDTVLVAPNTYRENIDFLGKRIMLKSTAGPETTVIDGNQMGSVVLFVNDEPSESVIEGFTITNGYSENGGGIYSYHANPTITGNIIHGNRAEPGLNGGGWGGGIFCDSSSPDIVNNTFYGNESHFGGGISCGGTSTSVIMNNIISGNSASFSPISSGGGIYCGSASPTVTNTILWDNVSATGPEISINGNAILTISYSDVEGGQAAVHIGSGCTLDWQDGMIDEDPDFVNAAGGDFHLTWLSPCINRGTNVDAPAADIDGDNRPYMGTVEMGSDEYTGVHSMAADTFFISQATGGVVNFALDAGAGNGGRNYLVFGGCSGTVPGFVPSGGDVTVPVNWDGFTDIVMANLNTPMFYDFLGVLAPDGTGSAAFNTLGPLGSSYEGVTFSFAFALNGPWNFATTPVNVAVVE